MFRFIIGVIVSIFMISLLRMIMTAISREMGSKSSTAASGGKPQPQQPPNISGGELRKCPECGSYHTVANLAGRTAKGEVVYFCSPSCREKHRAA